ncbi:MAG: molybdopterin-dependent oxidoreductase [Verrucomicrobiota bacterium]
MRVWFLKETKSICPSCATGCNLVVGSREDRVYRYEPRQNDSVNSTWMCDYGRLNYKWIHRADRLTQLQTRSAQTGGWSAALAGLAETLRRAAPGSVAMVASARQSNEELYLLSRIAKVLGAVTDSIPRFGEGDRLLLNADRNPNSAGAQLTGISAAPMGSNLAKMAAGIEAGKITTLLVVGEDVTKHGLRAEWLRQLQTLVVADILPNATTAAAHYLLPGCAHVEKRGTFTNVKGRVQKFTKAVEPPGDARPEWEFLLELLAHLSGQQPMATIEGVFNQMARDLPALSGVTWAALGDSGVTVPVSAACIGSFT